MASVNYGLASISGSALANKVTAASATHSGSQLYLIPIANTNQILVVGAQA